MSTRVTCRCGQAFAAAADLAGRSVPCPFCGATIYVPPAALAAQAAANIPAIPKAPAATNSVVGANQVLFWSAGIAGAVIVVLVLAVVGQAILSQSASAPPTAVETSPPAAGVPAPAAPAPEVAPALGSTAPAIPQADTEPRTTAPPSNPRPGVFILGAGMYELRIPGGELMGEDERESSAGVTLAGGALLPSDVRGAEIRSRIDEFRAGNTAELGDLTISWAVIIKPRPSEPAPNKNPAAMPIEVNGLSGIEVRGQGNQLHWAFGFNDHSLMISARGPERRINSAEVRSIIGSLRRKGGVPAELAERAKLAANP